MRVAAQINFAASITDSSPPFRQSDRSARWHLNPIQNQIGQARQPKRPIQPLGVAEYRVPDSLDRVAQLLLGFLPLRGEACCIDVLCLADNRRKSQTPLRRELGAQCQNVGNLFLALSQPLRIIVEEVPAKESIEPQLMPHEIAAQHYAQEFAGVTPVLCRTEDDFARNFLCIVEVFIRKREVFAILQFQVQCSSSPETHRSEQSQRSS